MIIGAIYQGRKVKLNAPKYNPSGSRKKFSVFVEDPQSGKVLKVQFGDPEMRIRKSNPERRRSFRARHKCDSANDVTSARYWSCKMW